MLKTGAISIVVIFILLGISCKKDDGPAFGAPPPAPLDYRDSVVGTYIGTRMIIYHYSNYNDTTTFDSAYTYQVVKNSTSANNIYVGAMNASLGNNYYFTQAGGPLGLTGYGYFYGIASPVITLDYRINHGNIPFTASIREYFYGTKQ